MKYVQKVAASGFIRNKNKQILIVKRADDDTYPGQWELPGGGVEFGEEPYKGLKREIGEEVGLDVQIVCPLYVGTFSSQHSKVPTQYVDIVFLCNITGSEEVKLSHEHSAYRWISFEDVDNIQEMTHKVKNALEVIKEHTFLTHI
jgi:8-oxo-dGTP diphosphatase